MFYSGSAVPLSAFFNRQNELAWLLLRRDQLLKKAGQPTALLGMRKSGKTSLLYKFLTNVQGPQIVTLSFSVPFNPTFQVFSNFLYKCLSFFLAEERISFSPDDEQMDVVMGRVMEIPLSTKRKQMLLQGLQLYRQMQRQFRTEHIEAVLEFPAKYVKVCKKKAIIVWDEFQNLLDVSKDGKVSAGGDLLGRFREIWQRHDHIMYIVCGSEIHVMHAILNDESSPFFSHFQPLKIGPFSEKHITELLQTNGRQAGVVFSDAVCKQYFQTFGGIPFYAQVIGDALVRLKIKKIAWRDVLYVVQQELWHQEGRLYLYFLNTFDKICANSGLKRAVLIALSKKHMTVSELALVIQSSTGSVSNALPDLNVLISENEGRYYIQDPAFSLWLMAYDGAAMILSPYLKGNEAEIKVASDLAQYGIHSYFSRGSRSAIDLLIEKNGKRAAVQVKKHSLPAYLKKSEWQRLCGESVSWRMPPVIAVVDDQAVYYFDATKQKNFSVKGLLLQSARALENILLVLK